MISANKASFSKAEYFHIVIFLFSGYCNESVLE